MAFGLHPALLTLIVGTILYFGHAILRGRTSPYQIYRALKADFNISLLILLATFLVADYFLYQNPVNSYPLHFLQTIIAIILGFLLSKRLNRVYMLTG